MSGRRRLKPVEGSDRKNTPARKRRAKAIRAHRKKGNSGYRSIPSSHQKTMGT